MHIWMAGECWRLRRALPVTGHKAYCCNWWTQGMRVHMGAWFLDDVDSIMISILHWQCKRWCCFADVVGLCSWPCPIKFPSLSQTFENQRIWIKFTRGPKLLYPSTIIRVLWVIQHYRTLDREISWNLTTKRSKLGNYLRLAMKDLTPLHFHKARVADSGISGPCIRSIRIHSLGHLMVPRKYRKLQENCC